MLLLYIYHLQLWMDWEGVIHPCIDYPPPHHQVIDIYRNPTTTDVIMSIHGT